MLRSEPTRDPVLAGLSPFAPVGMGVATAGRGGGPQHRERERVLGIAIERDRFEPAEFDQFAQRLEQCLSVLPADRVAGCTRC